MKPGHPCNINKVTAQKLLFIYRLGGSSTGNNNIMSRMPQEESNEKEEDDYHVTSLRISDKHGLYPGGTGSGRCSSLPRNGVYVCYREKGPLHLK